MLLSLLLVVTCHCILCLWFRSSSSEVDMNDQETWSLHRQSAQCPALCIPQCHLGLVSWWIWTSKRRNVFRLKRMTKSYWASITSFWVWQAYFWCSTIIYGHFHMDCWTRIPVFFLFFFRLLARLVTQFHFQQNSDLPLCDFLDRKYFYLGILKSQKIARSSIKVTYQNDTSTTKLS